MDQEKIGNIIKSIRKKNKLTQAQFAEKYGVTYQAVSNWEHGKNLPDISLIKQISKDFNVSIEELLGGKRNTKNLLNKKNIIIVGILIIIFIILIFIIIKNINNFEFKTISSNCSNFNISGSISYNKNKTSIFINDVDYCGVKDNKIYTSIECILYETNNNVETQISSYENTKMTLDKFLKDIEFTIDDYSRLCKNYTDENLYIRINATEENGKTVTYKIPLSLNDTCK